MDGARTRTTDVRALSAALTVRLIQLQERPDASRLLDRMPTSIWAEIRVPVSVYKRIFWSGSTQMKTSLSSATSFSS